MKRTSFADAACPVARSLDAVGDVWAMLVVRDAFAGKRRFGEFERSLGIAKNILTDRLRKLVERGVLAQVPAEGGHREYALTAKGRRLLPVLAALARWGGGGGPLKMVDPATGKRVRLELRSADGRTLTPDEVRVVPATE